MHRKLVKDQVNIDRHIFLYMIFHGALIELIGRTHPPEKGYTLYMNRALLFNVDVMDMNL